MYDRMMEAGIRAPDGSGVRGRGQQSRALAQTPAPVDIAIAETRTAVKIAIALTITAVALLSPLPLIGQDWHTTSFSRQVSGEEHVRVDVEYGAGRLSLAPGSAGTLYRANLRYDAEAFKPRVTYSGSRLRIGMEGNNVRGRNLKEGHLDLRLSPNVPLDLELAFGAADATLELGGLRIRSAEVHTGASRTVLNVSTPNPEECRLLELEVGAAQFEALGLGNLNTREVTFQGGVGEVTLDFTGEWRRDMTANVEMGLGALILRFPRDLGVRVTRSGMLASFDSQRLTKRGDVYYSENWDDAQYKLTLNVEAALGSIRVEWVDS